MIDASSNQTRLEDRTVQVRDPMAIDLLLNLVAMRHFAPFVRGPQTLGTAARDIGVPPSSMAYWVGRLRRVGLIEVVELRKRAGKPIPVYVASAGEYRIPLDAMPPGAREQFLHGGRRRMYERFTAAIDTLLDRHMRDGLVIKGHPDRGIEIGFPDPVDGSEVPVTEWWGSLRLTPDDADKLNQEMSDLISRYQPDRPGRGRRDYMVVMGFAPLP
ncbi:MAG TPA: hypothetical protein VMS14_04765 [Ilumatobacteraceae bacterium]|nr:hypothetical protein [Ilumatobacteraceae bacterium]